MNLFDYFLLKCFNFVKLFEDLSLNVVLISPIAIRSPRRSDFLTSYVTISFNFPTIFLNSLDIAALNIGNTTCPTGLSTAFSTLTKTNSYTSPNINLAITNLLCDSFRWLKITERFWDPSLASSSFVFLFSNPSAYP